MILERIQQYLGLVRFAHTVFALPFALTSALVAARGWPTLWQLTWILVCMVTARTSAMTFNRIVDRELDRRNPRTQTRHLPAGTVSLTEALALWGISSLLFIISARLLNPLAFYLSPLALLIVCGYSFTKRFTSFSHFILGLSLGVAPVGAWIGIEGSISLASLILAAGVLLWVAGFDIIYALMDEEFDRAMGLQSLVVHLGKSRALKIAFVLHCLSVSLIALFGWITGLGWIYFTGVIAFAILIIYEHSLVSPEDTSRVNLAFFNVNGIISIGLFFATFLDIAI